MFSLWLTDLLVYRGGSHAAVHLCCMIACACCSHGTGKYDV